MKSKHIVATLLAATMISGTATLAVAAEKAQPATAAPGMQGMGKMPMEHGMMGSGGMMDMMGMMNSCHKMTSHEASGNIAIPRMPPGNERLEFQMRAEMMQKMGEIAAKYADKIKEGK